MPIVTKTILKGYFETGDRPTEAQFIDLIDSLVILGTGSGNNVQDVNITGDVTVLGSGSFTYLSASGNVVGLTGSFGHLEGDGSGLANVRIDNPTHGNKTSLTGSIIVEENSNETLVTNNTGEYTVPVGSNYTVGQGAQIDLQYTPIAERLYRYDVDTGTFKAYAQANIDSETTLMKGFGAGTAGVGNDITIRYNATVPENFVTTLFTTTHNVTQSEDPNNNPIVNDPHSITIQDQSTYTIKQGADVTVDGVHHGVVRKDIALFQHMGIGDTQAIGPSGSNSFNDQYNNIYPSASTHLHISASNPVVKIEAASGTGLLSIDGNISASGGTVTALSGSFSHILGNSPITVQDPITFQSPVTMSGNISSSGYNYSSRYYINEQIGISYHGASSTYRLFNIDDSNIGIGAYTNQNSRINLWGAVTASGDISASGTIFANDLNIQQINTSASITVGEESLGVYLTSADGFDITGSGLIVSGGMTDRNHHNFIKIGNTEIIDVRLSDALNTTDWQNTLVIHGVDGFTVASGSTSNAGGDILYSDLLLTSKQGVHRFYGPDGQKIIAAIETGSFKIGGSGTHTSVHNFNLTTVSKSSFTNPVTQFFGQGAPLGTAFAAYGGAKANFRFDSILNPLGQGAPLIGAYNNYGASLGFGGGSSATTHLFTTEHGVSISGSLNVILGPSGSNISSSGFVSASGFDTRITTAAEADAFHYSVNGRKVEVRNKLQAQVNDGTFTHLELRNTSIATDSIVLGSFTGNTASNITGSIITAATTALYTASIQIHNETGENIANDTPYTASFIVL